MTTTRDRFNAFLDLPEVPVSNARSGPLAGLTLGVKDIFDVAGYPTGWGNPQRLAECRPAESSAPAVQALLDAGARFVGKTQTEELAFSMLGQNVHFPHPVNPAAPNRVTGGSSSGSVAAVAGGLVDIATGSDTGGSVRAPAAFCGLIGLRTTHGAISLEGTMPLAPSFDTFGWFARDMDMYERVGEVLLGAPSPLRGGWPTGGRPGGVASEARDAFSSLEGGPLPKVTQASEGSLRTTSSTAAPTPPGRTSSGHPPLKGEGTWCPLRIAALDALLMGPAETAEYARIAKLAEDVLGAAQETAPPLQSLDELYWATRKLQAREAWDAHGAWIEQPGRKMGDAVLQRFLFGKRVSDEDVRTETARRREFTAWLSDLLAEDGILVLPTLPCAAPRSEASPEEFSDFRETAIRLLCWSGLSGFPQITLPLGAVHGAPFGLSLLGPAGSDLALIKLARKVMSSLQK